MARTSKSRANAPLKKKFTLRSNRDGNTTFKMMGSRTAFPKADPTLIKGVDSSAYKKADPTLIKGIDKSAYKKTTPYKDDKDRDDEVQTNNIDNTDNVDDTQSTENMSFSMDKSDIPDPDREDGGIPDDDGDVEGSGYQYDAKGKIIPNDPSLDPDNPNTKVNVTDQFGKDTDAAMEGSGDDIVDSQWSHPKGYKREDTYLTDSGEEKVIEHRTLGSQDEIRGKQNNQSKYKTSGNIADTEAFSQNPVSYIDDDGELVYATDEDVIGDDYYVPTGIAESELEMIGLNANNPTQKGLRDPNAIYDAPGLSEGIAEGLSAISGRDVYEGTIQYGDDAGKTMKLVQGNDPDGNLTKKKVLKDGLFGLNRKKEITKANQPGLKRNRNTGELEYTEQAKETTVSKGPLGLGGKDVYVDGKLMDKEYKQDIKDAKKKLKQDNRDARKEEKRKKKEVHNKTKHLYKGMNANEANTAKNQHRKEASAMGLTYEQYAAKHLPPPPKDESVLGLIKNREQNKLDRKEKRKNRTNYDDYTAYNDQPY